MSLKRTMSILAAALMLATVFVGCSKANDEAIEAGLSGEYTFGGSTTVEPVAVAAIEAFEVAHEGVKISYDGVGSSAGVTGVLDGTYSLGGASRELKDEEKTSGAVAYPIALDGIAVIVNENVEVDDLSLEDLAAIFAGEIKNWSEIGGADAAIVVVNRDEASGTRAAFFEMVLEKVLGKDPEPQFIADAVTTESNGDMVTKVGATPDAIGYCGMGYLAQAKDAGAKAISVAGIPASIATVLDGTFPISRKLNIISNGELAADSVEKMFLDFLLSAEGQKIVEEEGFIGLNAEVAEEAVEEVQTLDFAGDFSFGGSTTVEPIAMAAIEAFAAIAPDAKISYDGVGSSAGVTGVIDGTYTLGGASRNLKDEEVEQGALATEIANDGVAVIVSNDVAVDNLTLQQIADIFAGNVTNWSEVGGEDLAIVVVNRDEASGTRAAFFELVLEKVLGKDPEPQFIADAVTTESNGDMVTKVGATPGSIGYCGMGYLEQAKDAGAKTVLVDGIEPTMETVLDGSFPIARKLNIVTLGEPVADSLEAAFIEFLLSEDGQMIVEDEGFIPLAK